MEKGSSSSSSRPANAADSMTSFKLFGTKLSVPVASMAMTSAPAVAVPMPTVAQVAASETTLSLALASQTGSGQGQQPDMSLSLQLFPLRSTPAAVSVASWAPMMTDASKKAAAAPDDASEAAAPDAAVAVALSMPSLESVTNALAVHRQQVATQRASALLTHLRRCAEALGLEEVRRGVADSELVAISRMASSEGDATQRMAAAFGEALALVVIRPCQGATGALFLSGGDGVPSAWEATLGRQHFLNMCPMLRLAAAATNELILEAMKDEKMIHVVDLGGVHHGQWVHLIRAISRREDQPHVRLTIVQEHKGFLSIAARKLRVEADRLDIPFVFNSVESSIEALDLKTLRVKRGYALAIVSTLQLHRLIGAANTATSTTAGNKRKMIAMEAVSPLSDAMSTRVYTFLRGIRELSPKIMVVTEPHVNHFGPPFKERFESALEYYQHLFGSLEEMVAAFPSMETDRKAVERYLLKEEIKDIIACKDWPRWARHEPMGRWVVRLGAAGFVFSQMNGVTAERIRSTAQLLPGVDSERYGVLNGGGWFAISRKEKPIFFVSAWKKK
ncbi:hypothetical protein GUJ93_ZPchr0005g16026 [Zizania palustris]|uniref:Uncharacterized protein n=1 Tax=Zizania palustris TaxID=103762 RepID=A0A8J5T5C1_ZIZPA|nr:hypothetical protein GUJ93_ZPchr0005g16026 [Zizania palustris]